MKQADLRLALMIQYKSMIPNCVNCKQA